jgi:predicted O-methyltransferase YrrM
VSEEKWSEVDGFIADLFINPDPALDAALKASQKAGLPAIEVSPSQGKLLMLLAKMASARRILEIGTLGGYSTIWLARALPDGGRLITLEANEKHAEIARKNLAKAGLADKVEVRVGPALDTLPKLAKEGGGPFDFAFIDADKTNNSAYFDWALRLSRKGSVIITDNVVRWGAITDAANKDPRIKGTRDFMEVVARERRVSATAIQTVGVKGHDGFAIALVVEEP